MSDPANPSAPAPAPAAPASPQAPAPAAPSPVPGAPVTVHVHTTQPTPSSPAAPTQAPQAPSAQPPAVAPAGNPWALRPPKPAAPAAPAPQPVAASPATPAPPAVAPSPEVAALQSRVDAMATVMTSQAADAMGALPENLRAYVLQRAGNDPVAQLNEIRTLRAHNLIPAPPQVVQPGATTLPAQAAPPAAQTPANPDLATLTTYEALRQKSPHAAAAYLAQNMGAITRARAARPS